MKKIFLVLIMLLANTFLVSPASSADTCAQLNTAAQADDLLTVTMLSVSVLEKTGSNQLTISYKQTNNTADKKLDEGSFSLFFADGTGMPQYGFFNYFFPGDSRQRTHTWEYLKSQNPIAITYNPGFFAQSPSANKLSWAIPGKACQITTLNDKAAADKAAADKAAADKIAPIAAAMAAAAAATDAANAATDAANIAADAIDPETLTFLDELDLALQKAKVNGVKTELNYKKVLKDTQVKLIQIQTKRAQAETLAEKSLTSSNDKSLAADTQRVYASANRSWTSTVRALVSVENQLIQRIERISNSQDLVNRAVEDFQKSKSASGKTGTPVTKTTLTCVKGKLIKKVTAIKPTCPTGYRKK